MLPDLHGGTSKRLGESTICIIETISLQLLIKSARLFEDVNLWLSKKMQIQGAQDKKNITIRRISLFPEFISPKIYPSVTQTILDFFSSLLSVLKVTQLVNFGKSTMLSNSVKWFISISNSRLILKTAKKSESTLCVFWKCWFLNVWTILQWNQPVQYNSSCRDFVDCLCLIAQSPESKNYSKVATY